MRNQSLPHKRELRFRARVGFLILIRVCPGRWIGCSRRLMSRCSFGV